MASSRASDIKLLVGGTVAVLLVGALLGSMVWVGTRGSDDVVCGTLNAGSASGIRKTLDNGGPEFTTGGATCGFYLALADGDIVAYKAEQIDMVCTLLLERDHWECGGRVVDASELEQYPVEIRTIDELDAVIVDLRPVVPATTGPRSSTT